VTLKKKILTGYGVAFTLMGLVVVWAVMNLVSLGKASDAILRENYRSILAAENMFGALERQDSGVLLLFLGDTEKGISQFHENEAIFLQWLARAKDNITEKGEADLVRSIERNYAKYRQQFSELTDLSGARSAAGRFSLGMYHQMLYPSFVEVRDACIQLRKLNEEAMYAASVRAGQVARRAIWSTAVVAASALIVALLFSLLLAERIVRPLRRFMEASRSISTGDYSVQVPVETSDELGLLAGEFNQMASQLAQYHEMNIEQIISEKNKGDAILSSIEEGLVVFDTHLKVTGINPAARRMLNLEFSEPQALHCTDILPVPNICEIIQRTVDTGMQPNIPEDERVISLMQGERSRHYLFSATPVRGRDRSLSGIVLLLRDITRLKELERLKSEFVMAASHELRTPLTSIGMSIDLLLENVNQELAEKDRELLQAAHEEVQRMKALVNDLLDLSKIEAGRIQLEFERIQVHTLFEHVLKVFKRQAEMKDIRLTSEVTDDLPLVRADTDKVVWVLTNLISNALRYVGAGGQIQMSAKRIGQYVHLSVRDNGPGIPPEYQTKIFEKFAKAKEQDAARSGLGLAICKEIVHAHGGAIWVDSSPGQGSTFTFTLPVAQ
jgi:NtrC-family two-component system sensor histidine kinase KinB